MVPEVEKEKPKLQTPAKAEPGEDDELRQIKELYQQLDVDGDAKLSIEEIKEGLKRLERDDADFIYQLLIVADVDGSGEVDFEEFSTALQAGNLFG